MKKVFTAEGVTEYPPGAGMSRLQEKFGMGGAVMLALDVSYSMSSHMAEAVRGCQQFMKDAIGGGYQVGIIIWNETVVASVEPRQDPKGANRVLRKARASGGTDVVPALFEAASLLEHISVSDKVIAVFGDGGLGNQRAAIDAAASVEAQGMRIITMGLGSDSAWALSAISTETRTDELPRTASVSTLTDDIKELASGLRLRRTKQ